MESRANSLAIISRHLNKLPNSNNSLGLKFRALSEDLECYQLTVTG